MLLDSLYSDLEKLNIGKIAQVVIDEAVTQIGVEAVCERVEEILLRGLKDYNPPGPQVLDRVTLAIIKNRGIPVIKAITRIALKEKYPDA